MNIIEERDNNADKLAKQAKSVAKAKAINCYNNTLIKFFGDILGFITLMGVQYHCKMSRELKWMGVLSRPCGNYYV